MRCSYCNKELNDGTLFCGNCGHKVEAESKQKCPNCGSAIGENESFCGECGFEIPDFAEEDNCSDKSVCPSCGNIVKSNAAFCGKCGFPLDDGDGFSAEKKSSVWIWLAAAAILVIVVFAAIVCFWYFNIREKPSESIREAPVIQINHNDYEAEAELSTEKTTELKETETSTAADNTTEIQIQEIKDEAVTVTPKDTYDNPAPDNPAPTAENDYEQIEKLYFNYGEALGNAVNFNDYSIVGKYIQAGSPLEAMQLKLVANLYGKGTKEYFADAEIGDIYISADGLNAEMYIREWYDIYYIDGSSKINAEFNWKYSAVKEGESWKMSNLESY